jgi:hypothetical protein
MYCLAVRRSVTRRRRRAVAAGSPRLDRTSWRRPLPGRPAVRRPARPHAHPAGLPPADRAVQAEPPSAGQRDPGEHGATVSGYSKPPLLFQNPLGGTRCSRSASRRCLPSRPPCEEHPAARLASAVRPAGPVPASRSCGLYGHAESSLSAVVRTSRGNRNDPRQPRGLLASRPEDRRRTPAFLYIVRGRGRSRSGPRS